MTRHHTYVFGKELHTRRGQFFCWEKVVLLQFVMTWKLNQAFLIEFPPLSARYIEESILGNNHRLGCSFLIRLLYPDYSWHPEGKVGFIHTSQYLTKQKRKSAFFIKHWRVTLTLHWWKRSIASSYGGLFPLFHLWSWVTWQLLQYRAGNSCWLCLVHSFIFSCHFYANMRTKQGSTDFSGTPIPVKMQKFSVSTSHYAK